MNKVTAPSFRERKQDGDRIAMLTAYDYPTAKLLDECEVDAILVGDSCAMAVMGRKDTLNLTMDEILHHVRMVAAATENALVVADMPFMSYQISTEEAVRNAGRLIAEGGAGAVKLEGPASIFGDAIAAIIDIGIPVMGHLGLTPQSVNQLGGYKVQGKKPEHAERILDDAKGLDEIGCFGVVLECVPASLAKEVTASLDCPTIGIGAGQGCDGQILVMHDILGWGFTKFTKTYVDVKGAMEKAFTDYVQDVKAGVFPAAEHAYK